MAMTFEEVQDLAKKIIKIKPDPIVEDFKRLYDEMTVHTQKRKPDDKLLKARPNEPDDIINYRSDNFEPITYGSFIKAFDTLFRVFTSIGIKIQTGDEECDKYLLTQNFMNNTFMMFYAKIYLKRMIEDSNGWLLWLPGGLGAESRGASTDPYPELMFSFNIIDWTDEHMVFLSNECSLIESDDSIQRIGKIYYILTKTEFYTYTEMTGGKYELLLIYQHKFNKIPVVVLGGDVDSNGLYQSFFEPAVALANETIRQFSDWQALSIMAAHPIREEFQVNCQIQEIKKKKVRKGTSKEVEGHNDIQDYKVINEIKPMPRSVFGTIYRTGTDDDNGMGSKMLDPNIPSVRFISPGIEYVKNAFETFQKLLKMSEDNLHLNLGEYGLSGEAKKIDKESEEDMLNKIFLQIFDSMIQSASYVVAYKKQTKPDTSTIKLMRPASLRPKSEVELMEELTKLKTSNGSFMLICAVARELGMLRFSGDELNIKIFDIISTNDILFAYTPMEKQSMYLANTAKKEDVINSNYMYSILLRMAKKDGEAVFLEKDNELIFTAFLTEVKKYYTVEPVITDDNGK